jgi:hypothetical protein
VIVVLQGVSTHERRQYLLRRLQWASVIYFVESLNDTHSNMNRYFDDANICGTEGTSAPNAVECVRLREIDSNSSGSWL